MDLVLSLALVCFSVVLMLIKERQSTFRKDFLFLIAFLIVEWGFVEIYQLDSRQMLPSGSFEDLTSIIAWIKFIIFFFFMLHIYQPPRSRILAGIVLLFPSIVSVCFILVHWGTGNRILLTIANGIFIGTFAVAGILAAILIIRFKFWKGQVAFSLFLLCSTCARVVSTLYFIGTKDILMELQFLNSLVFMGGVTIRYLLLVRRAIPVPAGNNLLQTNGGKDLLATKLSFREMETVRLIAAGHSYKEIADRLAISLNTVRRHVNKAYRKLGINNRRQLVQGFDLVHPEKDGPEP